MALMSRSGSSSAMSSMNSSVQAEPEAMGIISSLFSPSNPIVRHTGSNTFNPRAVSKPTKAAVIDWQLSKPEIIRVSRMNYTSLRDLMLLQCDCSSAAHGLGNGEKSPRTRMKNHLLEQVARAYMPLNMEQHNKSTQFFPWNWQKLMSCTPLINSTGLSISGWFSGFSLSGALRYLLGRSKQQPVRFLKHRIC